jgi:hypothetical protein
MRITTRGAVAAGAIVVAVGVLLASGARADGATPDDDARAAFKEGAALIDQAEWASAIGAFERSFAAKPHALTLYNIGVCQRFLGRYTLARETLRAALRRDESAHELAAFFADQARAYLAEIDGKLAHLRLVLDPPGTRVAVDGRPLAPIAGRDDAFVAGVADAGEPKSLGRRAFEVVLDPRPTVLTFSLPGYDTIEVRRDPKPGSTEEVPVSMSEQPARIRVASNVPRAVVRVDGVDVGLAPVTVTRPPGVRLVSVSTKGYVPFESKLTLKPGQTFPLDARLAPEKQPLTKKWWFWTVAAAVVAGAGLTTYFVVRPAPERPAPDAGGLGWLADVR